MVVTPALNKGVTMVEGAAMIKATKETGVVTIVGGEIETS